MSVAWFDGVEKEPPGPFPTKGAPDGSNSPYPRTRSNGRGHNRPFLPHRRRLLSAQSQGAAIRFPQKALGLGDLDPCALPAAPGRGVRALLPARRGQVLLPPVPRGSRARPVLAAPPPSQAR